VPVARVTPNAPPFLVIHGSKDSVIPVEQAQSFVQRLRGGLAFDGGLPGVARRGPWLWTSSTVNAPAWRRTRRRLFLTTFYRTETQIGAKEVI